MAQELLSFRALTRYSSRRTQVSPVGIGVKRRMPGLIEENMDRGCDNVCGNYVQMPCASAAPVFFAIKGKWLPSALGARATHRTRRPIPLEELMG